MSVTDPMTPLAETFLEAAAQARIALEHAPHLDDGDVRLYHGDALEQLRLMPSESVQCIVTSPPFWGLRDYQTGSWDGGDPDCDHVKRERRPGMTSGPAPGYREEFRTGAGALDQGAAMYGASCGKCGATRVDQQIGLEETPDEWCNRLVAVMREARRVLRNDGVCWIEVGDSYAAGKQGRGSHGYADPGWSNETSRTPPPGLKHKDLCGAPWLLAFALRADGWYLRSDTIWARPNPMPESVTDRPTKAHSYVFLLTKSARYFYDADAIREASQASPETIARNQYRRYGAGIRGSDGSVKQTTAIGPEQTAPDGARNARSVWSIPTEPTPFAHFATFPQALVERCIKAGTSEHGACSECGAPWRRVIEKGEPELRAWSAKGAGHVNQSGSREEGSTLKHSVPRETIAWTPSCDHEADPRPCLVLDPFMGSGTTALVARKLGRHAIGIELNTEYLAIAAKRLQQLSLLS